MSSRSAIGNASSNAVIASTAPSGPARGPSQDSRSAIALAAEQHRLALLAAGHQHQHRVGLAEAAEVPEVAVLAIRIVRVVVAHALGGGRQDDDRVAARHAHQLARRRANSAGLIINASAMQRAASPCARPQAVAVQQQHADAHEFEDFDERGFVLFGFVVTQRRAAMRPRSASASRASAESARSAEPARPKPPRNPRHQSTRASARRSTGRSSSGSSSSNPRSGSSSCARVARYSCVERAVGRQVDRVGFDFEARQPVRAATVAAGAEIAGQRAVQFGGVDAQLQRSSSLVTASCGGNSGRSTASAIAGGKGTILASTPRREAWRGAAGRPTLPVPTGERQTKARMATPQAPGHTPSVRVMRRALPWPDAVAGVPVGMPAHARRGLRRAARVLLPGHRQRAAGSRRTPSTRCCRIATASSGSATQGGLHRYDGYAFRVFQHRPNDAGTLPDSFVTGARAGRRRPPVGRHQHALRGANSTPPSAASSASRWPTAAARAATWCRRCCSSPARACGWAPAPASNCSTRPRASAATCSPSPARPGNHPRTGALAIAQGALWAATDEGLYRIDPREADDLEDRGRDRGLCLDARSHRAAVDRRHRRALSPRRQRHRAAARMAGAGCHGSFRCGPSRPTPGPPVAGALAPGPGALRSGHRRPPSTSATTPNCRPACPSKASPR